MFHCSTIRWSTVPPSDGLLFHHQMFYSFTIRCSTVLPSLFHFSTIIVLLFPILCSTVQPSDLRVFPDLCSTVPPSDVPLFHHLCSTDPPSLLHCSTITFSTVAPSDVPLCYQQMFNCSTIRCSTDQSSPIIYFNTLRQRAKKRVLNTNVYK